MHVSRWALIFTAPVAVLVLAGARPISAQVASNSPHERFTALAVNISNVGRTGATPVDINIERWTSDAESDKLLAIFKERGPEKLLDALRDTPRVGTISTPGSLAYDLHYARQQSLPEGGRRIVIATDRPVGFWEATSRPRTIDYPFTLIELRLNRDNRGEGKLNIAAKLTLNGDVLIIEDYANQPVMLNDLKKTK